MNVFDAIRSKLDIREFGSTSVDNDVKRLTLEAARLSSSGLNSQHWRFILVDTREGLEKLAEISTTGKWISGASFAVIVLTDPKYPYHDIDAGRAIAYMQLAAWEKGVGSGIYTGFNEEKMRQEYKIPANMHISAVVGFGYPRKKIIGKKSRLPLTEIAYHMRYGNKLDL
ncbi:MAG TPA: nitroreductase [Candidatus Caldiarchaeum subterraneum]|uniref:Nitroreductase n=1 Tax=Caldiarchaeum subterraneum TaxID=311458 RepID=A0A833A5Q7_CALS0|nr:nitroreductase [Aigarchaeota archaeon]HIQ30528.1 nitroreductase [Candidatus Caldarchaeum subterraneum]